MNDHIFACFWKKTYYYHNMKKYALLLILVFAAASGYGQAQNYKVQSVFIYSFIRYVQWPEAYNQGDFEIYVLGDSPILEELKSMSQVRKVGDRSIKVTKINSASEIKRCNILFVSSKSANISDVTGKVDTQSILIVTEEPGLAAKGSDINLIVKEDGKPGFELNQATINKRGFKISLELIRLAILI